MAAPPEADRFVKLLFRVWSPIYDHPLFQRPFFRRIHAAVVDAIDAVDLPTPRAALDLGCGTAQLTRDLAARFPDATVVGADLSGDMLRTARRHLADGAPPLVQANVYALPLPDASIDLVTSTVSYHYYLEPRRALSEIRRVLSPDGRLVLATIATRHLRFGTSRFQFVPAEETADDLRASGLTVERTIRVRPAVTIFVAR
jgi:ubiquinone/menaquinone biosynthesis C-methylase UbiE